jgi:hypothetical protein
MDTDAMDSDVVSNQVSGATSALATADAVAPPMLEQRVELLLTELEQLVPLLPEAAMAAILVRVRAMAASASSCEEVAGHDGSPLRPEQLSYANAANVLVLTAVREDDARSEAGSIGSVGEAATSTAPTSPLDPNYLRHEDTSADDPRADLNGWGDLDIDCVGWQPPNAAEGGVRQHCEACTAPCGGGTVTRSMRRVANATLLRFDRYDEPPVGLAHRDARSDHG